MTELFVVDAFTERPFAGNPAAVCVLSAPVDDHWMQALAAEMNLPATAFLWPKDGAFALRWFTAAKELALCGHGTLASAHVLFERGGADDRIQFETRAGLLTAKQQSGRIQLDFPAERSAPAEAPAELSSALGHPVMRVERNRLDYLVELDSEDTVSTLHPDLRVMANSTARGLIVTARASSAAGDFVSRFFGLSAGLEDAVTGSAHCCLGPYWEPRLGKSELVGVQLSARGGVVHVQVAGDRVLLSGQAVTILHGDLVA
jgi:PhzF family phenazine biosynthesis protein